MKTGKYYFTSESVTEGHPDKICDQISDSVLDALIAVDPDSRVAVETLTTTGLIVVAGEVTTKGYIDVQNLVRNTIRNIGYDKAEYGFNADDCSVLRKWVDASESQYGKKSPVWHVGCDAVADCVQGFVLRWAASLYSGIILPTIKVNYKKVT